MTVAVITIGNSDDKLLQREWSAFVSDMQDILSRWRYSVYFHGCSVGSAPWQNACWVVDAGGVPGDLNTLDFLRKDLSVLCKTYRQDSIALTIGHTEMIKPGGKRGD